MAVTHVGVISDTHGLLRPEAGAALAGSDLILHAGDVGKPQVLDALRAIAPLHAVRGNEDHGAWASVLPFDLVVEVAGRRLYLVHDLATRDAERALGCDAVVFGHSHRPHNERVAGVLHFNPGSAGPRRFRLPVALGRLEVGARGIRGRIATIAA